MELCTGMQDSEEELEKFFEENPDFPQEDVMSLEGFGYPEDK